MTRILPWQPDQSNEELLSQTVQALMNGEIVVVPTEVGYVPILAVNTVDVLVRLIGLPRNEGGPVFLLPEFTTIDAHGHRLIERLANRLWPGPLSIQLPNGPDQLAQVCWMPRHRVAAAILSRINIPVLGTEPIPSIPDALTAQVAYGDHVALIVDAGPIMSGPTTRICADASGIVAERVGAVSETDLVMAMANWIGFFCTGNTCRSPMAEAICKSQLAARLGCAIPELPRKGFRVFSAGVAAYDGDGPTPEAVEVVASMGADLRNHRSRALTQLDVTEADHLIGMTRAHLLTLLSRFPGVQGVMRLLCGREGDLDDPIGGGPEIYQSCARRIQHHVDRILSELVFE